MPTNQEPGGEGDLGCPGGGPIVGWVRDLGFWTLDSQLQLLSSLSRLRIQETTQLVKSVGIIAPIPLQIPSDTIMLTLNFNNIVLFIYIVNPTKRKTNRKTPGFMILKKLYIFTAPNPRLVQSIIFMSMCVCSSVQH